MIISGSDLGPPIDRKEEQSDGTATVTLHFKVQSKLDDVVVGNKKTPVLPLFELESMSVTSQDCMDPVVGLDPSKILEEQRPESLFSSRLVWDLVVPTPRWERFEVSILSKISADRKEM